MPTWPATLPGFMKDGWTEEAPKTALRTEMDAGPAKVRRRFSAGVRPFSGQLKVTGVQLAALDDFYLDDCQGGAVAFDFPHPRTGLTVSARFAEPPKYQALGGLFYSAAVKLEILP